MSTQLDFVPLIADRTRDFTGREWVFAAIGRWLATADAPRTFLLTGSPGSGKTAVAARLVQMSLGQVASDPCPRLGRDALACFHFCQANNDTTLSPLRFVEALSRALANRYDAFRDALLKTGDRDITINATQSVTTAAGGSQVRNVVIEELHIGALSARSAFDHVVRSPLEALVASGFDQPVVVLVDSLDEALTFPGEENLVTLLGHTGDLPRQVRFILTSRPDKRVTAALGERTTDLIEDAPADVDDVHTYVEARLRAQADLLRLDFTRRVAEASQGNFLSARLCALQSWTKPSRVSPRVRRHRPSSCLQDWTASIASFSSGSWRPISTPGRNGTGLCWGCWPWRGAERRIGR
jgi:Cdc6-like AAA superfamily ATPase